MSYEFYAATLQSVHGGALEDLAAKRTASIGDSWFAFLTCEAGDPPVKKKH